jgi:hypothetical protein
MGGRFLFSADIKLPEVFGISEFIGGVLWCFIADWTVKLAHRDSSP